LRVPKKLSIVALSRRVLKFEVQHPDSYKVLRWKNDINSSSLKSG
jgi:hypothetical protein